MFTPSEKNAAEEKCLIKEKFQRELSGQGKEKTKGKQDRINKGPLNVSAQAFLQRAGSRAASVGGAGIDSENPNSSDLAGRGLLPWVWTGGKKGEFHPSLLRQSRDTQILAWEFCGCWASAFGAH